MPRAKWYTKLKNAGLCTGCAKHSPVEGRVLCEFCAVKSREQATKYNQSKEGQARKRKYRKTHSRDYEKEREISRERMRVLREQILALGDNKCKECGNTDTRCLQVDHVHGGGCREAQVRSLGLPLVTKLFAQGKLQVLCANCNWIKRFVRGEHKKHVGT